jgi:hypothetical protein
MKRVILTALISAMGLCFLILGLGCGTTKSVYKKVTFSDTTLKKRVLVLPLLDQAGAGEAKTEALTARLVELLKEGESLSVHRGTVPTLSRQRLRSPKFAVVIDPARIQEADQMGMNVLIAGVLNPREVTARKWGIWPIKGVKREMELSLLLNAYDIIDGTLFLTHLETRKIKLSTDDLESAAEGKYVIDETELEEELSDILEDQASTIRDELEDHPWRGKIMSVDGETVMVNAGRDIGLSDGSMFHVYSKGERIRSLDGKYFYLLGPKVGEIKTVNVTDTQASAVPVNGGPFRPGQIITIKN